MGFRPTGLWPAMVLRLKNEQPLIVAAQVGTFKSGRQKQAEAGRNRPPPAVAGPPRKPERSAGYNRPTRSFNVVGPTADKKSLPTIYWPRGFMISNANVTPCP
jgi:hypothetical protein